MKSLYAYQLSDNAILCFELPYRLETKRRDEPYCRLDHTTKYNIEKKHKLKPFLFEGVYQSKLPYYNGKSDTLISETKLSEPEIRKAIAKAEREEASELLQTIRKWTKKRKAHLANIKLAKTIKLKNIK